MKAPKVNMILYGEKSIDFKSKVAKFFKVGLSNKLTIKKIKSMDIQCINLAVGYIDHAWRLNDNGWTSKKTLNDILSHLNCKRNDYRYIVQLYITNCDDLNDVIILTKSIRKSFKNLNIIAVYIPMERQWIKIC